METKNKEDSLQHLTEQCLLTTANVYALQRNAYSTLQQMENNGQLKNWQTGLMANLHNLYLPTLTEEP